MLQTSGDILNLVLIICVSTLTFFFCWALFYVISVTVKAKKIIKRAERIVSGVEGLLETVKSTLGSSDFYLRFFNLVSGQVLDFFKNRSLRHSVRKKKPTKKTISKKTTVKKEVPKKKIIKK